MSRYIKTFVRLFKPEFVDLVRGGDKQQTVRPVPKRMPNPGDRISLRAWIGKPYRSKQRILREAVISKVLPVEIRSVGMIRLGGDWLSLTGEWDFARADGFNTPKDMYEWFAFENGLPFKGIAIYWIEP